MERQNCLIVLFSPNTFTLCGHFISAPPSKMREPYSNHSVCPSVCLSTLRCNAITQKVFNLEMEDKKRKTPIDFGVNRSKVKVIVTCPQRGPLWLCQFSSYVMWTCYYFMWTCYYVRWRCWLKLCNSRQDEQNFRGVFVMTWKGKSRRHYDLQLERDL